MTYPSDYDDLSHQEKPLFLQNRIIELTGHPWSQFNWALLVMYADVDICKKVTDILDVYGIEFTSSIWLRPIRGRDIDRINVNYKDMETFIKRGVTLAAELGIG